MEIFLFPIDSSPQLSADRLMNAFPPNDEFTEINKNLERNEATKVK